MSFWSWLTGRNDKEADVYANYDKVEIVTDELRTISKKTVGDAQDAIYDAMNSLNAVHGMSEYVGALTTSNYNSIFESVGKTIENIADAMEQKAEDIKTYEEAPWYEKVGSSISMGLCKLGEGLLSVVEDLGDGVVSIVGWGANLVGAKDFSNDCANFVKKEWSHDAFNFYYNSEFAKKSAFTEDSALAGGLKIVGKVAGYVAAGYAAAGAMGMSAASQVTVMGLKATGATWGATAVAGLGGLGTGTETGLNEGKDFNSAIWQGAKTGVTQAAFAFAGGKLGEKISDWAAAKTAAKGLTETVDDQVTALAKIEQTTLDDQFTAAGKIITNSTDDMIGMTDDVLNAGANAGSNSTALTVVSNTSDDMIGMTDDVLNAGTNAGSNSTALTVVSNTTDDQLNGIIRAVSDKADEMGEAALKVVSQGADDVGANGVGVLSDQADDIIGMVDDLANGGSNSTALTVVSNTSDDQFNGIVRAISDKVDDLANMSDDVGDAALKVVSQGADDVSANGINVLTDQIDDGFNAAAGGFHGGGNPNIIDVPYTEILADGTQVVHNAAGQVVQIIAPNLAGSAGAVAGQTAGSVLPMTLGVTAGVVPGEIQNQIDRSNILDDITSNGIIPNPTPHPEPGPNPSPFPIPDVTPTGGTIDPGEYVQQQEIPTGAPPTYSPSYVDPQTPVTPVTPSGGGGGGVNPIPVTPTTSPQNPEPMTPPVPEPLTPPPTVPTTVPTSPTTAQPTIPTVAPTIPTVTPTIPTVTPTVPTTVPTVPVREGEYDGKTYSGSGNGSIAASVAGLSDDSKMTIDEIIKGKKYGKIPKSNTPIFSGVKGSSAVVPIAAGLTAASAAGLGAKAYVDMKKASYEDDEEEEEFENEYPEFDENGILLDNWTDEETIDIGEESDEFINIDKSDEDEYYRISENPLPIMGSDELEEF